jgi:hypothetical protein
MDAERGYLGFPVSDVEKNSSGSVSFFQRGSIVRSGASFQDYPDAVMFTAKLENAVVKCATDFGMNSRGEWYFRGHLHNDGFAGNVTNVATSPMFVDAGGRSFVVTAERSLGGTTDFEDRNDDWNQMGSDDFIRDNWDFIKNTGIRIVMKSNATFSDILALLLLPITAPIILGVHIATRKWCGPVTSESRNPETGENSVNLTWVLVDPDQPCPPGYQ